MRRAGFWVVVLALSVLGAFSAFRVGEHLISGEPRNADPAIYYPALGLIALVAIVCALIVRRLLSRRGRSARRPVP